MSSSEGENYGLDDVSGSDFEDSPPKAKSKAATKAKAPAKPKAAPKAKATATKAAKPKAAPKKKVLEEHDDNGEANEDDEEDDEVGELPSLEKPGKKKSASETYTKLTQLEHILLRPDSYIGSVETITQTMWTYDSDLKRMANREVKYVPGFFKIVDEILVNAADNKINDPTMDTIKVTIDAENGVISVYNNGRGIPIEMHSTEKMYIPELIFGHLLSSSNYDDNEKKLVGGRNGYGAKLANIYSHEFTVETADKNSSHKYKQTWTNNMSNCGKAKITQNNKGEEWTRVTFKPDLKRFKMDSIDPDTEGLLKKRVYDLAGTVKDVKVFLNDERLKIKGFKQYVDMYISSAQAEAVEQSGGGAQTKPTVVYEQLGPRWEIAFTVSDGTFQHVSFANSISTSKGGTHVMYIADQLAKTLITAVTKKNKGATVKPAQIKNHMWLFVNSLIENPTFDSQTKETMTLPASKFGTKPTLSDEFMKKVQKTSIIDNILNWAKFKADQQLKKTDGNKRSRLTGLTKLSDANNAGTRYGKDCTLILTEGDSAKALAVAGLGVVGRDNFGVFPLRGKLLNVREASSEQIVKNEEIQNIKKIMGLQHKKDYNDTSSLRYGRLMIMTDQDHDGSHIKGLLINFLDHFYPSLLKIPEFLVEFVTPIVRVTKGKQRKDFFTIPEYEQWLENTPGSEKWDAKYYKGLGTSQDTDARDYFSHMEKHMIPFAPVIEDDRKLIDLAFSKKKADDRKEWLRQFKPGTYLDHNLEEIPYSEFINKELILFSMADNIRSIPSVADGLKPGQRKVIWGCFKRKMKKEVKVAQLVGYIAEHSAYHHGEVSLGATIINLAQNFVGSNNVSLLLPNGQYGTREQGGKNHASPRYIFTLPSPISRAIFPAADDALLTPQKEENLWIEPEFYMPVLPMVLVNGAEGIGTGWSTSLPCYNPINIVDNIRRLMKGEELEPMIPWWRGFKGEIKPAGKNKYDVFGVARKIDDSTVEITELPIHVWTEKYKADLETMMGGGEKNLPSLIKDYKEHHDNRNVHFVVTMGAKEMEKAETQGLLEYFKLTGKLNTSNMICFDFDGKIRKYDSPEEILEAFYPIRLAYYQKRKDYLAGELETALDKLNNQARFIQMIVNKELVVSNRKKADIVTELKKLDFRPFPKISAAKKAGETADALEDEEDEDDDEPMDVDEDGGKGKGSAANANTSDYDYLLGMPIYSLTKEKIERLKAQAVDKEKELMTLLERTPKSMWNDDLDIFLQEWAADCQRFEDSATSDSKGKKPKKKQAVLRTRKSLGGGGRGKGSDDDDDDFRPTNKAAAKRKVGDNPAPRKPLASKPKAEESDVEMADAAKSKPVAPAKRVVSGSKKKAPVKSEAEDSDFEMGDVKPTAKKASSSKATLDSSEFEDDVEPPPKKAAAAPKRKAAAAKPLVVDSDSDDDFDTIPSKPKAKAAPKKTSAADDADSESDDPKPSPPAKSKPAPKRKSVDKEEDSDDDISIVKPTAKKTKVTDFFSKPNGATAGSSKPSSATATDTKRKISKSMKPASPPKPKAKAKAKLDSDSDDDVVMDYASLKPAAPAATKKAPARTARAAATKKYIEVESDDDDNGSIFEDD